MKFFKSILVIIFSILLFYCLKSYVYSASLLIENKTTETYTFRANKFSYTNEEIEQINQATDGDMVIVDTFVSDVYPGPTYEYSEEILEQFYTTTNFSSDSGYEYYVGFIPIELRYMSPLVGEAPQNSNEVIVDINYCMQQFDITDPTKCIGRTIDVYSENYQISYTISGVFISPLMYDQNSNVIFLYQPTISYEELTPSQQAATDKYLYETTQVVIDENTSRISYIYANSVDASIKSCDEATTTELCYEKILPNDPTDIMISLVKNTMLAATLLLIFILNYRKISRRDTIVAIISVSVVLIILSLFSYDIYNIYRIISYLIILCILVVYNIKLKSNI